MRKQNIKNLKTRTSTCTSQTVDKVQANLLGLLNFRADVLYLQHVRLIFWYNTNIKLIWW